MEAKYGVVEIESQHGSIFKSVNLESDTMEGDVLETMTDSGRQPATVVGVFTSQEEADLWANHRNCE